MKASVSKCLVGLTILVTTTWATVARADWVRVLTDQANNVVFYIEPSTIQLNNSRYYFLAHLQLITPEYLPAYEAEVSSANVLFSTDCNTGDFQAHQEEGFDAQGNSLGTLEVSIQYSTLTKGADAIKNFVCN